MKTYDAIEKAAAAWVARAESPHWDAQQQQALEAWLMQDTAHRVAWLRLRSVWQRANRLAVLHRPPVPSTRRWSWGAAWAIAASVMIMALLFRLPWGNGEHRYETALGEHQTVALADGSQVELNTRTRLRTEFDPQRRAVWLDQGEAFFNVAPDPAHPFVIHAGDHRVVVLGTQFSVRRERERIEVAVLEGKVRVEPVRASPRKPPVIVQGGDLLYAKPAGTVVSTHANAQVRRALSWRHGILEFDQSTLQDAAAQFNRYNHKQLVLLDESTARLRIGGSFDATGVEAFSRLLAQGFNLKVEQQGDQIRVSQPK